MMFSPTVIFADPSIEDLRLELQSSRLSYKTDDPIELNLIFTNVSSDEIVLDFSKEFFELKYNNLDGTIPKRVMEKGGYSVSNYLDVKEVKLAPGEQFTYTYKGTLKDGPFNIVDEKTNLTKTITGTFLEFGSKQSPVYDDVHRLEVSVDYDFFAARTSNNPQMVNPNIVVTKVENDGRGLTTTAGYAIKDAKMLKSNSIILEIGR